MTRQQRSHKSTYLLRQLAAARSVLASPIAPDHQRHFARCRLNRTLDVLRRLEPIPAMRRELEVDRRAERQARA